MQKNLVSLLILHYLFFSLVCCAVVLSRKGSVFFEDLSHFIKGFIMSTPECYNCNPRLNFHKFLRDITWVNADFPDANVALLEGLRSGFTGYATDKIVQPAPKRNFVNSPLEGYDYDSPSSESAWCNENCDDNFKYAEQLIFGTTILGQVPGPLTVTLTNPAFPGNGTSHQHPPLKRSGTLTVRPTIGEERKTWILEARKAYCLEELQRRLPPPNTTSAIFYRDMRHHHHHHHHHHHPDSTYFFDNTSMSCPNLWAKSSRIELDVKNVTSQASIRLSPRMEKLDKLIPKTSKEFLNTLRVVSTISPQNSDEQIVSPEHDKPNSGSRRRTCERKVVDISSRIDLTKSEDDESPSDVEHGGKKRAMMPGRSYKEVCLFGHSSAPPSARVCSSAGPQEKPLMPDYRSSSCFPSLPKKRSSSGFMGDDDNHKSSPPLYSSILQRSPTPSSSNCSGSPDLKPKSDSKQSPCYDCGFCRTNNEPESVYRSHPLRVNGVVICPTLRKYVCCFCGATGDKAHTIKYCPENPIGFFAKKGRHHGSDKNDGNNNSGNFTSNHSTPKKSPEKTEELSRPSPSPPKSQHPDSSWSDSESQSGGHLDLEQRSAGLSILGSQEKWIEAKPKGRKKKNAK